MDTVTITPYKEGMDTEQTKREMDIHADGYKQGYNDAVNIACEWLEKEAWIDGLEFRFDINSFRKAIER